MAPRKKIDFKIIKENIKKENLDMDIIRIIYKGLSKAELAKLGKKQSYEIVNARTVLGAYPKDSKPLFPSKAKGMWYLGA